MNLQATQIQVPMIPMQQPAPYTPATVTSTQTGGLDISSLINSILPIFMLMMVMGMIDTQSHHFEARPRAALPAR